MANYVAERIKAEKGGKLAFRDMYRDYEAIAQRRGETALDPEQRTASLAKLCEGTSVARDPGHCLRHPFALCRREGQSERNAT